MWGWHFGWFLFSPVPWCLPAMGAAEALEAPALKTPLVGAGRAEQGFQEVLGILVSSFGIEN